MVKNLSYIFTYITGYIPEKIKPFIEHNTKICKKFEIDFKIFPFNLNPGECAAGASDWLRIERACKEPNIMYIDWDCRIEKFPEFNPKIPILSSGWWKGKQYLDVWAFYNGNRLDIFQNILDSMKLRKGQWASYSPFLNYNEKIRKQVKIFSQEYVKHMSIATGRNIKPVIKGIKTL
jgi:hypothetical protein